MKTRDKNSNLKQGENEMAKRDKEGYEANYWDSIKEWARISPCCKADVSCYGSGGACCRKCYAPLDDEYLALPLLDSIENRVHPKE